VLRTFFKARIYYILLRIIFTVTFALLFFTRTVLAEPYATIKINEFGLAKVNYDFPVKGNLSFLVQLIGTPDPTLGILVVDEKGLPLPFQISQDGSYLSIATLNSSYVYVSYYTQSLTSKREPFWVLNVEAPYEVKVFLPINATPLDMNLIPINVYTERNNIIMEYSRGNLSLMYTLIYPPSSFQQATSVQTSQARAENFWWILPLLVLILVIATLIIRLRSKRAKVLAILVFTLVVFQLSTAPSLYTSTITLAQSAERIQSLVHCRNQVIKNITSSNSALLTLLNLTSSADSYLASVSTYMNDKNYSGAFLNAILALRTYGLALEEQEKLGKQFNLSFIQCKAVLALEHANLSALLRESIGTSRTCEWTIDSYYIFVEINESLRRLGEMENIALNVARNENNVSNVMPLLNQAKQLLIDAKNLTLNCHASESAKKLAEAKRLLTQASSMLADAGATRAISHYKSYGLMINEKELPYFLDALRRNQLESYILNKTLEYLVFITGNTDELIKSKNNLQQLESLIEMMQRSAQEPYRNVTHRTLELISETIDLSAKAPELAKNNPKELEKQAQSIANNAKQNMFYPISVTVFDWGGKPLKNMMVVALPYGSRGTLNSSLYTFTDESGKALLYVPPDPSGNTKYQLLVYWRDSYLLRLAGKIPREIVIFDTVTDYDTPRLYKPGSGTTLDTFVYVGIVMLKNAQGQALSPDILNKITVEIQWPDQVVTTHKPENDGRVPIILNKNTAKSWPHDASANRSPDTDPRDISQAPPGVYVIRIYLRGKGMIWEQTIEIKKGRFEASTQIFIIKLPL